MACVTFGSFARGCGTNLVLVSLCFVLIACGRARKSATEAELVSFRSPFSYNFNVRGSTILPIATKGTAATPPHILPRAMTCSSPNDARLNLPQWFDAASRACFPGSERRGAAAIKIVARDQPADVEIPVGVRDNCWIALIALTPIAKPMVVEVLEVDGAARPFATISDARNIVPPTGPFCSLRGHFNKLRFKTDGVQQAELNIIWYAVRLPPP